MGTIWGLCWDHLGTILGPLYDNFLDNFVEDDSEIIVTPHVTSPFIKLSTIISASKYLTKGYDTVQACTEHKEFTYFNGKPVNFETEVNEVLAPKLPDLDTEFFKSAGIEAENVESFKKEVRTKLEEDLVNIVNGKVKQSLYDALLEANEFEVPLAMVDSEVSNMKQDTARRMGMDPKDLKEDLFPDDMFKEEATKRVKVGILLNKVIEEKELKPDADKVKEIIEERAKNYKDPQQVINYFYSDDEQLRNIESISLEEQVVDALKLEAKSNDENISYEDCVSGTYG